MRAASAGTAAGTAAGPAAGPATPELLLLSGTGGELLGRLAGRQVSPDRALALSAALREEFPPDLVAAALTQQALRMSARAKFGRADQMLFTRAGLEQASSEQTARHAAGRFAGARLIADLCCGIGGNLVALARLTAADGAHVVGVDADLTSVAFAKHNVLAHASDDLSGRAVPSAPPVPAARSGPATSASVVCADVREFPLAGFDAVFIDPARRDGQRRLPAGQYRPPLRWCLGLACTVSRGCVKAAPGIQRDLVPAGWETEFVAIGRELKEALLWSPAFATPGVASRATVLPSGETLVSSATGQRAPLPPVPVAPPGDYLLDPNPAVTRAGLVADLARSLGAWQIDPMIAFLSCGEPVTTPFARTLAVMESAPWHEKRFAARLRELGIGSADIRRRGLAGDVAAIHRRLGLHGDESATIVLTRVSDRPWGLICRPLAD